MIDFHPARWVYCGSNNDKVNDYPELKLPVIVIYRQRISNRIFGQLGVAYRSPDLFSDAINWIDLTGQRDPCKPYAWLDLADKIFDEQFLYNLAGKGHINL